MRFKRVVFTQYCWKNYKVSNALAKFNKYFVSRPSCCVAFFCCLSLSTGFLSFFVFCPVCACACACVRGNLSKAALPFKPSAVITCNLNSLHFSSNVCIFLSCKLK